MKPFTLKEIADFCYKHQTRFDKRKRYIARTWEEWGRIVVAADKNKTLWTTAKEDRLVGVSVARKFYVQKMMYVYEIICIEDGFWMFVNAVERDHPDWGFIGMRNNKKITIGGQDGQR